MIFRYQICEGDAYSLHTKESDRATLAELKSKLPEKIYDLVEYLANSCQIIDIEVWADMEMYKVKTAKTY